VFNKLQNTILFIIKGLVSIHNLLNLLKLHTSGVYVDYTCRIGRNITIKRGMANGKKGEIYINANSEICNGVNLESWGGNIYISENVFVGPYTVIYGHGGVKIGRDTLIAMHCRIISSNHTIPDINTKIRSQADILLPVKIGEDVWLGAGVTILGGVTIGNGCVVGAGSVVTKDISPYAIAVGVPAKVIRFRKSID